jgi:hypothetical protein
MDENNKDVGIKIVLDDESEHKYYSDSHKSSVAFVNMLKQHGITAARFAMHPKESLNKLIGMEW